MEADVTLGGNTVTVVLKDLQNNMNDAAQEISGFYLNLGSMTETSVMSETGTSRTVNSDGTFADGASSDFGIANSTIDWAVTNTSKGIFLNALTGASPDLMIIGPPASGGTYPLSSGRKKVNPSITGHNDQLTPTGTSFVLTLACGGGGQPNCASVSVSDVIFEFGTGPDGDSGKVYQTPTPEPRWGGMLLTLLAMPVAFGLRRLRAIGA